MESDNMVDEFDEVEDIEEFAPIEDAEDIEALFTELGVSSDADDYEIPPEATNEEQEEMVEDQIQELEFTEIEEGETPAIPEIPDNIDQFKELYYFSIKHNHLRKLPSSIGNINSLERLFLNNNHISELPKTIPRSFCKSKSILKSVFLVSFANWHPGSNDVKYCEQIMKH